ncbi:MAG: rRNA maturation RNase YbeY [Coriobacteriia bacterium]|nr:rRNA maturation RNase YbeY [Coriobacteriia bacterium]
MEVNILVEHGEDLVNPLPLEELCCFVMDYMKCPANTELSLSFVTDEKIHELNREYRGMDKPTDVLSFECDNLPFEGEEVDEGSIYELGDTIIATDVALAQTELYGTTFESEVTLLVTHSILHLLGYDHMEEEEAQEMEALEDEIIAAWNKSRA